MKKTIILLLAATAAITAAAQPAARRNEQKQQTTTSTTGTLTTRAEISFPTQTEMNEDVAWRRDIYREVDLNIDANAGLYYPVEPLGSQMNLFTYLFKLIMRRSITAYEYRLDGNEVFDDDAKVNLRSLLDNYHIYYERTDKGIRIDDSDIPSREVTAYYIKESTYYDQYTATFHTKVTALCPILKREDDFGDALTSYPLFWVKYDDVAPFLAKQTMMTSNLNNAATMSVDDYFTKNLYEGKIYKTTNMLGQTLAQYCPTDSAMTQEQKRIEDELQTFEKHLWGTEEANDTTDSIASTDKKAAKKAAKKAKRRSSKKVSGGSDSSSSSSSSSTKARVSVRRERH